MTNHRPPASSIYDHLTPEDLAAIDRRLNSAGLFAAHAYTDVTRLLAEVRRLRLALAVQRGEHANLLAAARATIAAARDHEPDPLGYLRDELDAHGQLPAAQQHASQLLAFAVGLCEAVPARHLTSGGTR
jgi:hypothetical protein